MYSLLTLRLLSQAGMRNPFAEVFKLFFYACSTRALCSAQEPFQSHRNRMG